MLPDCRQIDIGCSCGKTTLARLLAKRSNAVFKELSATDSGIADVRAVVEEAKSLLALTGRSELYLTIRDRELISMDGRRTILFLDEVHRFNKAQQVLYIDRPNCRRDITDTDSGHLPAVS